MVAEQVAAPSDGAQVADDLAARYRHLEHAIEHAAHLLPAQGPITVFIHHNTLHAFEELPFDEAVIKGARIFNCQPYLSEDAFRQRMARGRIRPIDLLAVLRDDLGTAADETIVRFGSRLRLRMAMLQYPVRLGPAAELRWFVAETDALTRYRADAPAALRERFIDETRHWVMRDLRRGIELGSESRSAHHGSRRVHEALAGLFRHYGEANIEHWSNATWEAFSLHALWRVCRDGAHGVKPSPQAPPQALRHRDALLAATGEDSDLLVHDVLVPFCAAYLDQGFSPWPLPDRSQGFWKSFVNLYCRQGGASAAWQRGVAEEFLRIEAAQVSPLESIHESLDLLNVHPREWDDYLTATLLALRGWAGMIRQMELRADRAVHPAPEGSLVEFLAVRLILERFAIAYVAENAWGYAGSLRTLRDAAHGRTDKHDSSHVDQRAFLVFQLAQLLGWLPEDLYHLTKHEWGTLIGEIEAFPGLERRRIFHQAFERHYRVQTLDAVRIRNLKGPGPVRSPRFQVVTCLDEREESFRRHLEELAPRCETFGAAGFFIVAMYYRGAADAHFMPLCPIVIRPQHWVTEGVAYPLEDAHRRRAKTRRVLGTASHQVHLGSRSFLGGWLLTCGFGVLASIPLVARILFPRLTARVRRSASRLLQPPTLTQLALERTEATPGSEEGHVGFTLEEMVDIADRQLRDIGLTKDFARLVFIIGHGSNSLNNPHNSAYNCGACGGGAGGPNARALAQILNDHRVREGLAARGLNVPDDTVFMGAYHNTCNDAVTFLDLERLPRTHHREFVEIRETFDRACQRNAHERCRRFQSAPLTLSPAAARSHVEERSEDLAQTRPECGHATNAVCMVGRRQRTRGLYMDRRTFLTSYDPTQDDEHHTILMRVLSAAVPVCAGINLEYYFSYIDTSGWGCGTKLPHNVTSLLGVMDGAASDLRPGLPWQMVEIHEPVRLLFIVETTPEAMLQIMDRNEVIGRHCRNGWVQLATLDPESAEICVFNGGTFEAYHPEAGELPQAPSSIEWYRGWRDHLGYALIEPEAEQTKDHHA